MIEKLERRYIGPDTGCGGATFSDVIDKINEIIDSLNEKKEQNPSSTEDMPYITDEHFYEREPADSFKYKLAEYMTRCCTKKEGPYGYEYAISAESILKMAEEELLKRGVVRKPVDLINGVNGVPCPSGNQIVDVSSAEWSEEDEKIMQTMIKDGDLKPSEIAWLKSRLPHKKEDLPKWKKYGNPSLRCAILDDIQGRKYLAHDGYKIYISELVEKLPKED